MTKMNTWHNDQPRTDKKTFQKKWDKESILWIITKLNEMTDIIDIQYVLVKKYGIGINSADRWVEIARRIMVDMNNGLTYEEAEKRDQERRNLLRRKTVS